MDGVFYKQLLKLAYYSQFPEIEMRGATIFSPFVVETVDSNDIVLSVDKHRYGELKYALRQIAEELSEQEAHWHYPCFQIRDSENKIIFKIGYFVSDAGVFSTLLDFTHAYRHEKRQYSLKELLQ